MPVITPRTAEVIIYQGDDLARLQELGEAVQIAAANAPEHTEHTGPQMLNGDEPDQEPDQDPVMDAAKAYEAFKTEAAERAVAVRLQQVGRRRFREARDLCKPREGVEADKIAGFDIDALGDQLVPESIIEPVMSVPERDAFLDSLSEADWDRLVAAVVGVNTATVGDLGKAPSIVSVLDQMNAESSKQSDPSA